MISLISSLEIINVIMLDRNISLWITGSAADAATVDPNSIETLLANGVRTFFTKGNHVFSDGPKNLIVLFHAIEVLIILY